MDTFKFVQTQSMQLYGAGASIGDVTVRVVNFNDLLGAPLAMTDFGTLGHGTLEPGTVDQEEAITWTGVTQNGDGTATLTGVKNQLGKAPYTQTSGLSLTHAGGTTFVISNTAGHYDLLAGKGNDETITGDWGFIGAVSFGALPTLPATTPTVDGQVTSKKYVTDSVSNEDTAIKALPITQWRPVHSGTFASGANSYVMTDATVTANSIIDVYAQGTPVGAWTVSSTGGSFTIYSSQVETSNMAFKYFINNF